MIKLMRPHHWIKNMLLFFPLFFSGRLFEKELFSSVLTAFIAFSMICSAVYIMNDYRDIERDRKHPTKRKRPLASGRVKKPVAIALMMILFAGGFLLLILKPLNCRTVVCAGVYVLINIIYSFGGKNIPVLDIVLLGAGYPLRVMLGGYAAGVPISEWLFLTMLCISFYLAFGKRYGEMKLHEESNEEGENVRPVLRHYTASYLENHAYLSLGLGIVFYSLWTVEKSVSFVWTVPLVLVICMLYNLVLKDTDGDPVETLVLSKPLLMLVSIYAVVMVVILYCA